MDLPRDSRLNRALVRTDEKWVQSVSVFPSQAAARQNAAVAVAVIRQEQHGALTVAEAHLVC